MSQFVSFEKPSHCDRVRGIVWSIEPQYGHNRIEDMLESEDFNTVIALLLERNPSVTHVRGPNGEMDSGDALSLGEVARLLYPEIARAN